MTQSGQTAGRMGCRWRAGHQQSGNGLPSVPLQLALDPGRSDAHPHCLSGLPFPVPVPSGSWQSPWEAPSAATHPSSLWGPTCSPSPPSPSLVFTAQGPLISCQSRPPVA